MSRGDNRQRGITLRRLTGPATVKAAIARQWPLIKVTSEPQPAYGYALGRDLSGTPFVISTEGVGWRVKDDEPLHLSYHFSYEEAGRQYGGMTQVEVPLTMADILVMAAETEDSDVDLADHIRVFGDRLETNFSIWHAALTKVTARFCVTVEEPDAADEVYPSVVTNVIGPLDWDMADKVKEAIEHHDRTDPDTRRIVVTVTEMTPWPEAQAWMVGA